MFTKLLTSLVVLNLLLAPFNATDVQAAKKPAYEKIGQLDFKNISVGDALKILSDHSDLNMIASQEASRTIITMYLKNISVLDVIDAIAKTYNLWYKHDRSANIIRIYTVSEYRLEQVEFKSEQTRIFTMKNAKNAIDLADTVCNLYGSERVYLSYGSNEDELLNDLSSRINRFDLINSATGSESFNSSGGNNNGNNNNNNNNNGNNNNGGVGGFGGNNSSRSNCVRNNRNNGNNNNNQNNNNNNNNNANGNRNNSNSVENSRSLDSIAQLLKDINTKSEDLQNILSGDSSRSDRFLASAIRHQAPIYVSVIKRQNRVLVRTRDTEAMKQVRSLYEQIDTESSMLLMEVKILSIDLSDGFDSLFDFKVKSDNTTVTEGRSATALLDQTLDVAATTFNPAFLATYVSDRFEARLQLLEQENRVTEVATPILLTTNQEVSRVFIGDERPIVTGYEDSSTSTALAGNATVINNSIIVPQTETRNLGTTLFLTPNINADRTVNIRILIERSGLSSIPATIPVQVGNNLVDANIDVVQTETFSGTVVAKDGTSIAVGGFINETAGDRESKVPVLGDIPGLGFFFREQSDTRNRTELVVIIRPFITTTPNEASLDSQALLDNVSIHPNSPQLDNLDVYTNRDKRHKGYQLEKPFKEYDLQDKFDVIHDKGERALHTKPTDQSRLTPQGNKQQTYVNLTRFAAETVRKPATQQTVADGINRVGLNGLRTVDIVYDTRIKTIPVASWRQGGIHVTALGLYNESNTDLTIDYKNIKGRWLASSIEQARLKPRGQMGDSTYLYLISAGPFNDIVNSIVKK